MDWIDTVVGDPNNRNVDWLTIHPRTRSTPSTTPIRADALQILSEKYAKTLPILLSGDVFDVNALPFPSGAPPDVSTITLNDILPRDTGPSSANLPRPSNTHVSGFMSARGLLSNPTLFSGSATCSWEAVERFMCNVMRAPIPFKLTLHHVHEMVSPSLGKDKAALVSRKERSELNGLQSMVELIDWLDNKIEEHAGQKEGMRRDF